MLGFENILAGRVLAWSAGRATVDLGGLRVAVPDPLCVTGAAGEVWLCIRAEDVDLQPDAKSEVSGDDGGRIYGRICRVKNQGAVTRVTLDCGFVLQACALARRIRDLGLAVGGEAAAVLLPAAVHLIPAAAD